MSEIYKIVIFETQSKKRPFEKWFSGLDADIQRIIAVRLDRITVGNFGDCEPLRRGIWELKIHTGPGYRVYFGKEKNIIVLILTGGLKKSQPKDIERAIEYWEAYKGEK